MGSFSELVLAFDFRADTPPEVLAAFASAVRPHPEDEGDAPELPAAVVEPDEFFDPDWRGLGDEYVDPFADEPWRHDWGVVLGESASAEIVGSSALVWNGSHWNFACRSSFKTDPESVFVFLEWLEPYLYAFDDEAPYLLGYIHSGYVDERPLLIWFTAGRLATEDLNSNAV